MPSYDLPLAQLRELRLDEPAPADLADFWVDTMARYPRAPTVSRREKVDNGLAEPETWDLSFPGYGDEPIHAWLQVPTGTSKPLPTVVQFYGYSWMRPIPLASPWVEAGYAHLHLESRGQGWSSASLHDLTPDWGEDTGATGGGLMTRGVQSPETYYYRRLITDAVRLVQLAGTLVEVNPDRLLLLGGSQGGGVSIAVAAICALIGTPVAGAMPDVPFLCSSAGPLSSPPRGPLPGDRWVPSRTAARGLSGVQDWPTSTERTSLHWRGVPHFSASRCWTPYAHRRPCSSLSMLGGIPTRRSRSTPGTSTRAGAISNSGPRFSGPISGSVTDSPGGDRAMSAPVGCPEPSSPSSPRPEVPTSQVPCVVPSPSGFVVGDRFAPRSSRPDVGLDVRPELVTIPGTDHVVALHPDQVAEVHR